MMFPLIEAINIKTTVINKHHGNVPPDAVFIGRGSKWGNQWTHLENTSAKYKVTTRHEAVACHREWAEEQMRTNHQFVSDLYELKGKAIVCYCHPNACHGHTLAELADSLPDRYNVFVGNPYDTFEDGDAICVTTNGEIKQDGKAVMGRGNAQFARDNFVGVDVTLGKYLNQYGNRCFRLGEYNYQGKRLTLASFPTKDNWRDKSKISLIEQSAKQVIEMTSKFGWRKNYIPIPGCGNGGLKWGDVKDSLNLLNERFVVYSLNQEDFE